MANKEKAISKPISKPSANKPTTNKPINKPTTAAKPSSNVASMHDTSGLKGLTTQQAKELLLKFGPNAVEEVKQSQAMVFLSQFWSPVPLMLIITIGLQLLIDRRQEAVIIFCLLMFNAVLSFFQERKADKTLELLKARLSVQSRVLRDGQWALLPAREVVPSDIIYLRMGDIAPADCQLLSGDILVDQSALTGESMPKEDTTGALIYASSIIKRGEATAKVSATGKGTFFGKSAELVRTAKVPGHVQKLIMKVAIGLGIFNSALALLDGGYLILTHTSVLEVVSVVLMLIIISIPIALQATFTLATSMGALQLSEQGVLVTHLSALENSAAMDVLCSDKTGTLTQNTLKVIEAKPFNGMSVTDLWNLASFACDDATQDPMDLAMLSAAKAAGVNASFAQRTSFIPFDPATKQSAAVVMYKGRTVHVIKGASTSMANLFEGTAASAAAQALTRMGAGGNRVVAVSMSEDGKSGSKLVGLIAFEDPLRANSVGMIATMKKLGLKIIMVTGDAAATAKAVAQKLGLGSNICQTSCIQDQPGTVMECNAFAGVFPSDKFNLVHTLQAQNYVVGMTGDGVNDAPALKQADVGIAVSTATDIAKSSAAIVLVESGLNGIISAVNIGRQIYQRMLTYILVKIIKSFEVAIFLTVVLLTSGKLVLGPALIVLLLFVHDIANMSISTDNVRSMGKPKQLNISNLMINGGILTAFTLLLDFSIFYFAKAYLSLSFEQLETVVFILLMWSGQVSIYIVREAGHFWSSRPGKWLMLTSAIDISFVFVSAWKGFIMTAISPMLILGLIVTVAVYFTLFDFLKIQIFRKTGLRSDS